MISLYSGTPGSGKSLHLARRITEYVKVGKYPIICNFPVNLKAITKKERNNFTYISDFDITPQYLVEFAENYWQKKGGKFQENEILLIIDEAQRLFDAREWNKKNRKEWNEFFQLHRHLGYEIIMVSQSDRYLDRQIRALFEFEYKHRKIKNFGWRGKILNILLGGNVFMAVQYWYCLRGDNKISQEVFRYQKKYSKIYDTTFGFHKKTTNAVCSEAGDNGDPADELTVLVVDYDVD